MPTIRSEVKIAAAALLGLAFTVGYFTHFPLPAVFEKLFFLSVTLLIVGASYGWGAMFLKAIRLPRLPWEEYILFSTVMGFGVWSLLMMLAGIFAGWSRPTLVALLAIGTFLGWIQRAPFREINSSAAKTIEIPGFALGLVGVGGFLSLIIAFAPPTYYDTLVYHYALPQSYLQAGRWIGQPSLIYSAFPQTMEMLWLLGLGLSGDTVANLLGWSIGAFGVYGVYLYGKRFLDIRTATWAAALLSVMPSYMLLASGGYVDVGLTVFGFMALYVLSLWSTEPKMAYLLLGGAYAGLAIGCKYTGAITLLIGLVFILKNLGLRNHKGFYLSALLYSLGSLVFFVPWMLKNIHYVGNPVFPFLYKWATKASPWDQAAAEGYFRALTEYTPHTLFGLGPLLWQIAVGGLRFGGGMDILGDLGWGVLFGLLPALWLAQNKPKAIKNCLLVSILFFIPWGLTRPVLRFLLPIAPFLALLSAYAYGQIVSTTPKLFRRGAQAFLAALLVSNVSLFFEASNALGLFQVPLGVLTRQDYLSRRLKYFRAASALSELPVDSLTYVVGDQCAYYYNRRVLVTPAFNKNPLSEWANAANSAQALLGELRAKGITHLLINHTELERLNAAYGIFPLSAKGKSNWNTLLGQFTQPVYRDAHCEVVSLS